MLVVLAGSGILLYLGLASQLDAAINEDLQIQAKELVADITDGDTEVLQDFGLVEPEELFAQILNPDGSVLESSHKITEPLIDPEELQPTAIGQPFDGTFVAGSTGKALPARFLVTPIDDGPIIIVGARLLKRNKTLWSLAVLLLVGAPILLAVVTGLAWFLAGAALRPVERMRQETAMISEGDLEKRLQVPATGDEIASLATTLNQMLARLEQAFEKERRFVDDASHELRTPLGILKTELELALRRSRSKEELEAALRSAAEESERLNRLADDLLVLARSDRGRLPLHKTELDVADLIAEAVDRFRYQAEERGVSFEISVPPSTVVAVDKTRLQQALGNLIDNALTHTDDGGHIQVSASLSPDRELTMSVADTGSGFPAAFIDKAFDPFARADAGRSEGGTGLGLAIVKAIVTAHGGSIEATNQDRSGALLTMKVPAGA